MTTHRPVIQDPNSPNCFWSLDLEGRVTFDGHIASTVELANMLDETERELDLHAEFGASDLCEICQRAGTATVTQDMELAEIQGRNEDYADLHATIESVRPF